MSTADRDVALLVDAHVHFHECFSWQVFLDAAAANIARARRATGVSRDSVGCLMFTESVGTNHFRALADRPALAESAGWRVDAKGTGSLRLSRSPEDRLVIVAGRQIVTAERLEVLALACTHELRDGHPIADVVRFVQDHDAIPVIPWGFGKWLGGRGRIVRTLVELHDQGTLFLGDNGGRMRTLPRPSTLGWAERRGVFVLPGSDPLPLADHASRAGSYGFVLHDCAGTPDPAVAITLRLRELRRSPPAYGTLSSTHAAIRSQIALRWHRSRATTDVSLDVAGVK
jgi:hypothetical protein